MADQRRDIRTEIAEDEIEVDVGRLISEMWKLFLRFWWAVILFAVIGAVGFTMYQRLGKTPLYESSATFTVATGEEGSGSYSFYYDQTTADQLSKTFPYVLESNYFYSMLLDRLGTDELNGTISAETITDSNVVTMRVESPDPQDAAEILSAALEIYPETARFVLGEIQFNMLDELEVPEAPFNQMSMKRSLVLGGAGGLFAAVCILAVMALFRKTARDPEEMKKVTSLKCLAMLPHLQVKARKNQGQQRISVLDERLPYGYRESMRSLRLRIGRMVGKEGCKVLLVTSTSAGEGKSTVAVNLAQMLAADGEKVLLVDGDLRKPSDAALLGIKGRYDLKDAAEKGKETREVIRRIKSSGLYFLGSTRKYGKPAAILTDDRIRQFFGEMRKRFGYVILDSPPCEMFQDAGILAEFADSVLYVVKYDTVPQKRVRDGLSSLSGHRADFAGYIFNNYPETGGVYGYGRYGYGKYGYGKYSYGKYGYGKYKEKQEEGEAL